MLETPTDGRNTTDGSPLCGNAGQTSRIFALKKALREALVQVGTDEANFGLARYPELEKPGQNPTCSKGHYDNDRTTALPANCTQGCGDNCKCGCRLSTHTTETTYGSWFDNGYRQSILVDVTKRPAGAKPVASDFDPVDANLGAVFKWIDLSEDAGAVATITDPELRTSSGGWYTPLGRTIFYSRMYFENFVKPNDPKAACRTNLIIVVTDGAETCDTTKANNATLDLTTCAQTGYGTFHPEVQACQANVTTGSKVYVLTDTTTGAANDNIARAGGTGSAIRVTLTDSSAVKQALISIIAQTVPPAESCNGRDDNCNGLIDEGVKNMCPLDLATLKHCAVETCNCLDDNCNGQIDEGLPPNACGGGCGCALPKEICNGLDEDCDGTADNGFDVGAACDNGLKGACKASGFKVCTTDGTGTVCDAPVVPPGVEVCNGIDDDCDGIVDNNVTQGVGEDCGPKLGACLGGKTVCQGGKLVCQAMGTTPGAEMCNGIDDNCNGIIDEGSFPGVGDTCLCPGLSANQVGVGECRAGKKICAGTAGIVCDGCVLPQPELCDGKDNDCDGVIDTNATCPTGFGCQSGKCVLLCTTGEFPCPSGYKCSAGICVPQRCAGVSCDAGLKCDEDTGACVELCYGVNCAKPAVCQQGRCVDCRELGCPQADQVCVAGSCVVNKCATTTCDLNHQYCDNGSCVDLCVGVNCPPGQSCYAGQCRADACRNVICETNKYCDPLSGTCKQDPCITKVCAQGEVCVQSTGVCEQSPCATIACPNSCFVCEVGADGKGACVLDTSQCAGTVVVVGTKGAGCSCRVPGDGSLTDASAAALLVGLVALTRRRSRR
jgi:MYXO-CTERM domain-containing protein